MCLRYFLLATFVLTCNACVMHDLSPARPLCENSTLALIVNETIMASKCGVSDGGMKVSATGGLPPYTYRIDGGIESTNGSFEGMKPGVYTVHVSDTQGCEFALSNISILAAGFAFEVSTVADTECSGGNGTISVHILEGTPPLQYKFMEGDFSTNSTFEMLDEGGYQVEIKDAGGCAAVLEVTVPRGDTNTSWSGTIKPIIESKCATSGCHNGTSRPDLRIYKIAKPYAVKIKGLTQDRSMPFEGSLTQEQIDLIACWVDEGAREN